MLQRSWEGEHLDVDACVHVEYWRCSPGTKPLAHAGTSMGEDRPPMDQQFFLIKNTPVSPLLKMYCFHRFDPGPSWFCNQDPTTIRRPSERYHFNRKSRSHHKTSCILKISQRVVGRKATTKTETVAEPQCPPPQGTNSGHPWLTL